jgi:hypothetical protein
MAKRQLTGMGRCRQATAVLQLMGMGMASRSVGGECGGRESERSSGGEEMGDKRYFEEKAGFI